MTKVALDTSVLLALADPARRKNVAEWLTWLDKNKARIVVLTVSIAECANPEVISVLQKIVKASDVYIDAFDSRAARIASLIHAHVLKARQNETGRQCLKIDTLIYSNAQAIGADLLTQDVNDMTRCKTAWLASGEQGIVKCIDILDATKPPPGQLSLNIQ